MRGLPKLLFILYVLMASTTLCIRDVEAYNGSQPIVNARREIEILDAGLLLINDTFTLEAPPGEAVQFSSFEIGFFEPFTSEQQSFYLSSNGRWQPIDYNKTSSQEFGFKGYELKLPSPYVLEGDSSLRIRASYIFVDIIERDGKDYSARLPIHPTIKFNLTSSIIQVTLPVGAEILDVDSVLPFANSSEEGQWVLTHEAGKLAPLQKENFTVTYTSEIVEEYLIYYELIQRKISIKPGKLSLKDKYIIVNRGDAISNFHVKLPKGILNLKAYDGVGPLNLVADESEENGVLLDFIVSPRISVIKGTKWSFTIEFSVPSGEYIDEGGGHFVLTDFIDGSMDTKHYVRKFIIVTTLPEGGHFIDAEPEPISIDKTSALSKQVIIELKGLKPEEFPTVVIEYSGSAIWSLFRPLLMAMIAAGAVASLYLLRQRRHVAEKPEAPSSVLKDFINLYRERVALLAEMEELDVRIRRKEISREQFDRRSAEITRHLKEQLRTLKRMEGLLETSEPMISDELREIGRSESELERVNANLRNLETRFRARRVSRRVYERQRREYLRSRGRARRRIEQTLATLQSEA